MNFLDPIAKNVFPSQNRSYQTPMNDQQFEVLLRAMVHVSIIKCRHNNLGISRFSKYTFLLAEHITSFKVIYMYKIQNEALLFFLSRLLGFFIKEYVIR